MRPELNRPPAGLDFILSVALVLASIVIGLPTTSAGQIPITVNGRDHVVPLGTTFADAIVQFRIKARSGNLLDVNGHVFRPSISGGRILIDGHERLRQGLLRAGDDIRSISGRDRTEGTFKISRRVGREQPGNPQFYLQSVPGKEVITAGRQSHAVLRVSFHPLGELRPDKAVALTFDDGPSPTNTPKILKILKHFHVKATFFVIGLHAKAHPDLVRKEIAAGMVVANHTWSHPIRPTLARLSDKRIRDEMTMATHAIDAVAPTPRLFRPSGGSLSPRIVRIAQEAGMRVVLWSADPKDWQRGRPPSSIVANVLDGIRPGAIVDMHDGGANGANTAKALPAIIKGIRARGLSVVALRV